MRRPVLAGAAALLVAQTAIAATPSGSAALATDYVWRGTSQTRGDTAVQAGVRLESASGWYSSLWRSNVEFTPETQASHELDLVAGWSGAVAPHWSLDLNLTRYLYPSAAVALDWTDVVATTTWRSNYWLQAAWSDDALATGEAGTYLQLGARLPVGERVHLEAELGRYWLGGADGSDYTHAQLGAVWAFRAPFAFRVTAHATDSAAEALFPGVAGSRLEAALQLSL